MSFAKKCDVCGQFYALYNTRNDESRPNGFMWVNIDNLGKYFSHDVIDCCPKCMDAIKKVVDEMKGD